jgi:hypothetical protein
VTAALGCLDACVLQDAASVDLLATVIEKRGEGYCRAFVANLQRFLAADVRVKKLVVVLDPQVGAWIVQAAR